MSTLQVIVLVVVLVLTGAIFWNVVKSERRP